MDIKEIMKSNLSEEVQRNLYLRKLAIGELQGPPTGYASVDKPWLKYYKEQDLIQENPRQTLYEHILDRNKDNMEFYALNYFGQRITYKEMFKKIDDVAKAFSSLGIKKGDVVSFCMPTTPETIYSIYALNKIGAIVNMIDLTTDDKNILDRINKTSSKYLVMIDFLKEKIDKIKEESTLEKVISVSPTNSLPFIVNFVIKLKSKQLLKKFDDSIYVNWNNFMKLGKNVENVNSVLYEKDIPALIVYTGGTTGMPKGAVLSNDGINSTILQLKQTTIQSKPGEKYLDIMPPFIAYGVVCGIHNPLSERQEVVIIPKFEASKFAGYLKKYKPNHVIGVPALFETMTKSLELKDENLDYLKNMICGGDKLTPASKELIDKFLCEHHSKAQVSQGFGMTEVGTSVTFTLDCLESPTANNIGSPLTHTNIKIVEPGTQKEVMYNERGEICITTPSIMLGYYKNDIETANVLKTHDDGQKWIHSQDIGYMNEKGELFFVDRMKRMIVRPDGHNVWPGVIENLISSHYAVASCVVVGIACDNSTNGAIPTAFIVLKDEYFGQEDKIIREIDDLSKQTLPGRDIALDYKIRESLPKTTVGKVDFRLVEQQENKNIKVLKKK